MDRLAHAWQVPHECVPQPLCQCCLILSVWMLLSCTPLAGMMNISINRTRAVCRGGTSSAAKEKQLGEEVAILLPQGYPPLLALLLPQPQPEN